MIDIDELADRFAQTINQAQQEREENIVRAKKDALAYEPLFEVFRTFRERLRQIMSGADITRKEVEDDRSGLFGVTYGISSPVHAHAITFDFTRSGCCVVQGLGSEPVRFTVEELPQMANVLAKMLTAFFAYHRKPS